VTHPSAPRRFDERWRLSRAGIVNVWHYLDNEFDLSGGRMILRGTNGSGKSRALEMLLPFLLDADRRKMDATGAARVNLDELMRTGAREQANRVKCASNLRQIGQGLQMYANENKGNFPRTFFKVGSKVIADNTGYNDPNSFDPTGKGAGKVGENNVCSSLFLLLKTQDLTSEVFICPSSQGERDTFESKTSQDRSNFTGQPT